MRERVIGAVVAVAACLAAATGAGAQTPAPLTGPAGAGHARVLVIGVDGARWDLVRRAMAEGRAPNLARLAREGLAGPTLLPYTPPAALTISEVGWSTIASGAGPVKHGVNGFMLNNDPGQATKNGYADFLTRAEALRPATSTFLASDWANIGLARNGGPIFGTAIDARYALAAEDTVDSYNRSDAELTEQAARYLRRGDPDAGFVYLGAVDETAHLIGSATPAYRDAIGAADKRIGALVDAIRRRPTYGTERWTVIVTTDHGQQDLNYPSTLSHGGPSELERTSF
ncbi:MAG TPA: alkaline phosphatase family protein, partial [Thermoleophilaceae bacterium]|nr:alkaline phosphatase family protein [Thermoleophilaceae bacterium]